MKRGTSRDNQDGLSPGEALETKREATLEAGRKSARKLVLRFGAASTAYPILNPRMQLWFSRNFQGVVGFRDFGEYRVASGGPVCAPELAVTIAREFERDAEGQGRRICYFGVEVLPITGHTSVVIGSQPAWNPVEWKGILARSPSLRAQLNRARNKGVTVEIWPSAPRGQVDGVTVDDLRPLLAEWLAGRRMPPMHFLVEPDLLDNLEDRGLFVALRNGRPVAYLIATPIPARRGRLIEQIVRGKSAPNGTSELLINAAMQNALAEGEEYLTLGLVPLARHPAQSLEVNPWWLRLVFAWVREHGRRFYNFQGLEDFKMKFRPTLWEPVYAAMPGKAFRPGALYAVAGVFGGMSPPKFLVWSLVHALRMELRWVLGRLRKIRINRIF